MVERPSAPVAVAISDCLLGRSVRYDGTHAAAELAQDPLAELFSYQGFCPEVGIGLGVPRPPIGLYLDSDGPAQALKVRQVNDHSHDFTNALVGYAQQQMPRLSQVSGYILMKNSPSCGLYTVKVRDPKNPTAAPQRSGRGAYAAEVTQQLPQLPVEENERLFDPELRHNFITRVFTYAHWQCLQKAGLNTSALQEFHNRYQYLLMAHSQSHCSQAGQLLSQQRPYSDDIAQRYITLLMQGLARPATLDGHINVLQQLLAYLKTYASSAQRQTVAAAIERFAQADAELSEPLLLLHSLLAEHLAIPLIRHAWQQTYFEPYPQLNRTC